jgi:uncharacterized protein YbbC (DUF1343 family)
MARVRTGLDRLAHDADAQKYVRGRKVGLVAHPASVNADVVHAKDVLLAAGAEIRALFGPEHGYGGEAQDMIGVENARDRETGAPIHSLYGDSFASLSPRAEWLDGLDVVVVDLQDVGSRYYTFVWTAVLVLRACAAAGIETLVLDRPNPLGGLRVEGAPQTPELCSFVGLRPVPVRHGLTIAEIVRDAARDEKLGGLNVITMQGWSRSMYFDETGLPWVYPSPNMPTVETAVVYPGGCLLEATRASEGRGTTRPFEVFGAPWIDGFALAKAMERDGGEGFRARPLTFLPTFQKHAKSMCGGVQVHVTDRARFEPYRAYLAALRAMRPMRGFEWRSETYEFVDEHPAIDLLTGDANVREAIETNASVDEMLAVGVDRLRGWDARSRWLYET